MQSQVLWKWCHFCFIVFPHLIAMGSTFMGCTSSADWLSDTTRKSSTSHFIWRTAFRWLPRHRVENHGKIKVFGSRFITAHWCWLFSLVIYSFGYSCHNDPVRLKLIAFFEHIHCIKCVAERNSTDECWKTFSRVDLFSASGFIWLR